MFFGAVFVDERCIESRLLVGLCASRSLSRAWVEQELVSITDQIGSPRSSEIAANCSSAD